MKRRFSLLHGKEIKCQKMSGMLVSGIQLEIQTMMLYQS